MCERVSGAPPAACRQKRGPLITAGSFPVRVEPNRDTCQKKRRRRMDSDGAVQLLPQARRDAAKATVVSADRGVRSTRLVAGAAIACPCRVAETGTGQGITSFVEWTQGHGHRRARSAWLFRPAVRASLRPGGNGCGPWLTAVSRNERNGGCRMLQARSPQTVACWPSRVRACTMAPCPLQEMRKNGRAAISRNG